MVLRQQRSESALAPMKALGCVENLQDKGEHEAQKHGPIIMNLIFRIYGSPHGRFFWNIRSSLLLPSRIMRMFVRIHVRSCDLPMILYNSIVVSVKQKSEGRCDAPYFDQSVIFLRFINRLYCNFRMNLGISVSSCSRRTVWACRAGNGPSINRLVRSWLWAF